jgi:nicotinamide-nucleotide amidase
MSAAVLSIGTEVVRGEIENTNATWLCDRLTGLGLPVSECASIADDVDHIGATLRRLAATNRVLVSTGGLGPTTDDLTTAAVAHELGVPLRRDEASLERIKALFSRAHFEFSESNAKQADFPEGARVLVNNWGSAPGFSVRIGECDAFFFPGVPREMKPMFELHVEPHVRAHFPRQMAQVRLRAFGATESAINDRLAGLEEQFDVVIGYRAHMPQVEVKALAFRNNAEDARLAAERAADAIIGRLGSLVYGRGAKDLPQVLGDQVEKLGWSLALAESCTGGLLSELVTREPASGYFRGAVVCYSNEVKTSVLGVPASMLEEHGAVSEAVVLELATSVRRVLGADVGIAISGVAGPSGGTEAKPVGFVHFAVSSPKGTIARQGKFNGDRRMVQLRAAYSALDLARLHLAD